MPRPLSEAVAAALRHGAGLRVHGREISGDGWLRVTSLRSLRALRHNPIRQPAQRAFLRALPTLLPTLRLALRSFMLTRCLLATRLVRKALRVLAS
jgi:hypothetical protein